jgi:hypothetical protein
MATIHQIEANRLNAQKSTGPRSATGKATASRNALKSGIHSQSQIIQGEKPEDLEALTAEYFDRFQPATPEERFFVDILIRDDWQLRRLATADAQIWGFKIEGFFHPDKETPLGHAFSFADHTFERLQRRINATERSYKSALREIQQLQSARAPQPGPEPAAAPQPQETKPPSPAIGFVPPQPAQFPPQPLAVAPVSVPRSAAATLGHNQSTSVFFTASPAAVIV